MRDRKGSGGSGSDQCHGCTAGKTPPSCCWESPLRQRERTLCSASLGAAKQASKQPVKIYTKLNREKGVSRIEDLRIGGVVGEGEIGGERNGMAWASADDGEGGGERQRCRHGEGHCFHSLWIEPRCLALREIGC